MAITYPTFTDGAVLAASQLNQLGDAVATLRSAIDSVNLPFQPVTLVNVGASKSFWVRHLHRWLVFRATSADVNEYDVTVTPEGGSPTVVLNNAGTLDRIDPSDWVDLDTVTGLDVGDFYRIDVAIVDPSVSTMTVFMLYERPT